MATRLPNNKKESSVAAERVLQHIMGRFTPIRGLDPAKLTRILEEYHQGLYRRPCEVWDTIEDRDPQCQSVIPKRKRAAALLDWEVIASEEGEEADRQKAALEYCYNHLTATHALKRDQRGGMARLLRQMMDAVGKGYAVHELVWRPARADGRDMLTAEMIFTPLKFFENRTGRLRFLPRDHDTAGIELEEAGWMITVADGQLMESTSVAYMFKSLPLKDWLFFSEKFGFPWVHGKTGADQGSQEWEDFKSVLANLSNDAVAITDLAAEITFHDAAASGERPHPKLVEYMDRAIAVLWRGGDLSTMSKGDAVGASQQEEERDNIEQEDALMLTETLQQYVDLPVLRTLFGEDVEPLAYIKILPKGRVDTDRELRVYESAVKHGVQVSVADFREKFSLPAPDEGEEMLEAPATLAMSVAADQQRDAANEAVPNVLREASLARLAKARQQDFANAVQVLERWLDDVEAGRADPTNPPQLRHYVSSEHTTAALEAIFGAHLVNAAEEEAKQLFQEEHS